MIPMARGLTPTIHTSNATAPPVKIAAQAKTLLWCPLALSSWNRFWFPNSTTLTQVRNGDPAKTNPPRAISVCPHLGPRPLGAQPVVLPLPLAWLVQRAPSQKRCVAMDRGSGYQPAGGGSVASSWGWFAVVIAARCNVKRPPNQTCQEGDRRSLDGIKVSRTPQPTATPGHYPPHTPGVCGFSRGLGGAALRPGRSETWRGEGGGWGLTSTLRAA